MPMTTTYLSGLGLNVGHFRSWLCDPGGRLGLDVLARVKSKADCEGNSGVRGLFVLPPPLSLPRALVDAPGGFLGALLGGCGRREAGGELGEAGERLRTATPGAAPPAFRLAQYGAEAGARVAGADGDSCTTWRRRRRRRPRDAGRKRPAPSGWRAFFRPRGKSPKSLYDECDKSSPGSCVHDS